MSGRTFSQFLAIEEKATTTMCGCPIQIPWPGVSYMVHEQSPKLPHFYLWSSLLYLVREAISAAVTHSDPLVQNTVSGL